MQEMSEVEIPTDNDGETDYVDDLMNMNGGKESLTMYGFTSIESRLEAKRAGSTAFPRCPAPSCRGKAGCSLN